MNLKIVLAAERLLQAFAKGDVAAVESEAANIADFNVAGRRKTSAHHYRVNFDGWELVVAGEFGDDTPFVLESVFLTDSAVDVTDLLGGDELIAFMGTWREEQEVLHACERAAEHMEYQDRLSA
ncbi:hypothetical protein [Paludibacterium purpuratum]|uniref:Uncharacterized protein n=1 Tax=Paludibacterium purpuratum TaxID=1144873 RepID=A0A4R7BBY7_9NEIS|nr:hypothetical protein [Paludibacterium purpuratum]TDR82173.1 hypothetical protein DFP86_102287 [Paludibacterium purpuratum]